MSDEERRRLGDELDNTNHQLYRGCVKSRKWYAILSIIRRLRRRKQSFPCRLSYDAQRLYALWIQKLNPVGFCVFSEICGNHIQRKHQ